MNRFNPGRFAAFLYLLAGGTGFYSYMYLDGKLLVPRDPAATARNVLASEGLFRLGMVAELVSSVAFIFLVMAIYRLFRNVDRPQATLMVVLVLVSLPISMLNVVNNYIALRLLKPDLIAQFSRAQLDAFAVLFLRAHDAGIMVAQIFWGLWLLPMAALIRRSGFMPRILGTLLIPNGLAYPAVTLVWLLAPAYLTIAVRAALVPQLGEAWLISWLLIKGLPAVTVDAPRERERPSLGHIAAAVGVACFVCMSAFAQPDGARVAYEHGREASARGDNAQALKYFRDAIALAPAVGQYHYALGETYKELIPDASVFGRMEYVTKAKGELQRAVELDPALIVARQSLIDFYIYAPAMMGGDRSAALEQVNEIRKRDPIEGCRAMARIHLVDNRQDLARKEYEELLKKQPASARAHYVYGLFLMLTEKNYPAASTAFASALQLDPTYMPAHFQIGHLAALAGTDLPRGENELKKYLGYHPRDDEPSIARAHYWLGAIYEKQHRLADAKASYAASLKLNPSQKDAQAALKRM